MLWRRRPNIRKLARRQDVRRLVAALGYRDHWADQRGRVYDLGAAARRDAALALATMPTLDGNGAATQNGVDVGAALIRSLADSSGEVRRAVAIALGARAERRAVTALTEAVLAGADLRHDASRSAALEALLRIGGPDVAETFVNLIIVGCDDLEGPRDGFLRLITQGGDEAKRSASTAAVSGLMRGERRVQDRAAEVLTWLGPQSAVPLVSVVQHNSARVPAIRALGKLRILSCTQILVELLSDDDAEVRQAAATALGEISDPSVARPLLEATGDPDFGVRDAAIAAVRRLGPAAKMSAASANEESHGRA